MTVAPDWALAVPTPGIHNAPAQIGGPPGPPIPLQQLGATMQFFIDVFVGKIAIAFGGIEILGWHPFQFLADWGQARIDQANANYILASTADGKAQDALDFIASMVDGILGTGHTVGDFVDWLQDTSTNAATSISQWNSVISGLAVGDFSGLVAFFEGIPTDIAAAAADGAAALDKLVNVSVAGIYDAAAGFGNLATSLLKNLTPTGGNIGQFDASGLAGALGGTLTFGGTALSTFFGNINSSGGLLASGLTGAFNGAVTLGGNSFTNLLQYLNSSGQFAAGQLTGAINGGLTLGGVTLSTLVTNINSSGQLLASGITGALGTGLTVGGVTLGTLFTNINSSGQLVLSGATGALNTAVTIGGTALSTLATNWNAAVTNVNSLISGVTGASTASDVATNINLAATNIAQIGTAAQNAAAGVVGSLNTAATQVQTAFSGILNGLFGGLTGQPSPTNYSQAQVNSAAEAVITNNVGNAATFVGVQNAEAAKANLMSVKFNFGDYGSAALPGSFTLSNDNAYYAGTSGSIEIVDGRAVYKKSGTGTSQKIARYNVAPTTTDYQEISWVHTGDQDGSPSLMAIYARMNSAATSYLKFELNNGDTLSIIAVVAGTQTNEGSFSFDLRPGAKYTIKCGDLTQARDLFLYENDVLVRSVGTSAAHQVGASYRYAGFGFSGVNTGTQPHNFGINVFSIADQVFKPGPAAAAYVSTSQATTSATYTDLTTTTDQVTVDVGSSGMALVSVSSKLMGSLAGNSAYASFAISGATTQAATDAYAITYVPFTNGMGGNIPVSGSWVVTGLAAGSTTFKQKYRVGSGTGTFADRRISVIPL